MRRPAAQSKECFKTVLSAEFGQQEQNGQNGFCEPLSMNVALSALISVLQ